MVPAAATLLWRLYARRWRHLGAHSRWLADRLCVGVGFSLSQNFRRTRREQICHRLYRALPWDALARAALSDLLRLAFSGLDPFANALCLLSARAK